MKYTDIMIVGGGIVGLTLACALAQRATLSVAVVEANSNPAKWQPNKYFHRVSAITLASQRIFQKLGIWDEIKNKRVSAFKKIHVWDAAGRGEINFNCDDISKTELGFIIENNVIQSTLEEKLKQYQQVKLFFSIRPKNLIENLNHVELHADDDEIFKAKLIIAADGAHSWIRQHIGIELIEKNYHQHAIVTAVQTELPHQQTAQQVFLKTGPLAFLPLEDPHLSSIVWSLPTEIAEAYAKLGEEIFKDKLAEAFEYKLGAIQTFEKRYVFPISKQEAKQYLKSRVVLVGDAAHVIHPLAGQGVNMGLLDAISLMDTIVDGINHGKDCSNYLMLRRYERWRKADNLSMQTSVDVIKNLFASDHSSIKALRSKGMATINQLNWIKKIFIQQAVGDRENLPSLAMPY